MGRFDSGPSSWQYPNQPKVDWTMTDEGYNGWTNYATWAVDTWLSNDQGLYHATLDLTRDAISSAHDASGEIGRTARALQEWVTNVFAPDLGATLWADLLGSALANVNWVEIADHWVKDVKEEA